jgi:plastocyanin
MRSIFLGLVFFLAGASAAAAAADTTVTIKNFNFAMDVTVTPGSTVTWTNLDDEPHTIASLDGLFRSPALDQNDSFRFSFDKPGVYKYICSIHPKMSAIITVK